MGKLLKLPGKERFQVPCELSGRWLEFPEYSIGYLWEKELLHLKVMTYSASKNRGRKLCDLYIAREDLDRALSVVKFPTEKNLR